MKEKYPGKNEEEFQSQYPLNEYFDLMSEARKGVLTLGELSRLREFGMYFLKKNDAWKAIDVFEVTQDFFGLRKIVEKQSLGRGQEFSTVYCLLLLEDFEAIRTKLNRADEDTRFGARPAFMAMAQELAAYETNYLKKNHTPIATGNSDLEDDVVAIRNIARNYDIAVPIARGGLKQGAIADLWGIKTKSLEIAAHKRKVARGKWIQPVSEEDFKNKRVLLFDKDAISGATIQKAVAMLGRFHPAQIGVYFAYDIVPEDSIGPGTRIAGLPDGIKIYTPKTAPFNDAGEAFVEIHEKLGTLYGRRRMIECEYLEEIQQMNPKFPKLGEAFRVFIVEQLRTFDSLNHFIPGIAQIRDEMIKKLALILQQHQNFFEHKLYDMPEVVNNMERILTTTSPLPLNFESELIGSRYRERGEDCARKRTIENPHVPSNPLAAFCAAREAVKSGFDIALIVGPEGFAYEPYFLDFGIETIAVNIPESGKKEARTIQIFDDLSKLKGKRVLVVEDDVRTGATLQKLLEYINPHAYQKLGLYLGQPAGFQKLDNISKDFEDIFVAEENSDVSRDFIEFFESKGLHIFRTDKP